MWQGGGVSIQGSSTVVNFVTCQIYDNTADASVSLLSLKFYQIFPSGRWETWNERQTYIFCLVLMNAVHDFLAFMVLS